MYFLQIASKIDVIIIQYFLYLPYTVINGLLICLLYGATEAIVGVDECQATRVIHFLQYPGCVPKPIPSYACRGRCSSYLQVRNIKTSIHNPVVFIFIVLILSPRLSNVLRCFNYWPMYVERQYFSQ